MSLYRFLILTIMIISLQAGLARDPDLELVPDAEILVIEAFHADLDQLDAVLARLKG